MCFWKFTRSSSNLLFSEQCLKSNKTNELFFLRKEHKNFLRKEHKRL